MNITSTTLRCPILMRGRFKTRFVNIKRLLNQDKNTNNPTTPCIRPSFGHRINKAKRFSNQMLSDQCFSFCLLLFLASRANLFGEHEEVQEATLWSFDNGFSLRKAVKISKFHDMRTVYGAIKRMMEFAI